MVVSLFPLRLLQRENPLRNAPTLDVIRVISDVFAVITVVNASRKRADKRNRQRDAARPTPDFLPTPSLVALNQIVRSQLKNASTAFKNASRGPSWRVESPFSSPFYAKIASNSARRSAFSSGDVASYAKNSGLRRRIGGNASWLGSLAFGSPSTI